MNFSELVSNIKLGSDSQVTIAIQQAGLLIERYYYEGQDFSTELIDTELAMSRIDERDVNSLIDLLLEVASNSDSFQSAAIWAIGKSRRADVVPRIIDIVKYSCNDDVIYQSMIALEDCDIKSAWSFIESIANSSLPKSKDFAIKKLELRSVGIYDEF